MIDLIGLRLTNSPARHAQRQIMNFTTRARSGETSATKAVNVLGNETVAPTVWAADTAPQGGLTVRRQVYGVR